MSTVTTTAIEKATDEITKALETCTIEKIESLPAMKQAIVMAQGMAAIRRALTDPIVEALLMPLQGSPLGFRTDKDSGQGYSIGIVRDCAIEAMVKGFRVVGNEFNIISGRAYFTREGFERRVAEWPGLSALELMPGVPHTMQGGALVEYRARWLLNGKSMDLVRGLTKDTDGVVTDTRIPVRVNNGMGADAVLGKARRKMLAHIYDRLTGSKVATADGDALEAVGVEVPGGEAKPPSSPTAAGADGQVDELVKKHGKPKPADEPKRQREMGDDSEEIARGR